MEFLRYTFYFTTIASIGISVVLQLRIGKPWGLSIMSPLLSALIGIAVIITGPFIQTVSELILRNAPPETWTFFFSQFQKNWGAIILSYLDFGIMPGAITAAFSQCGKNKRERIWRASIAGFLSLLAIDTLSFSIAKSVGVYGYLFSILSDVIGGPLAGYTIVFFTEHISILQSPISTQMKVLKS